MRIGGVVNAILLISILCVAVFTFYTQIPGSPIELQGSEDIPEEIAIIKYGATPVFSENLRFNHNDISFTISSRCSELNEEKMRQAFEIFENEMPPITFYEVMSDADINVECIDKLESTGEGLYAAGEGGPSKIVNTSTFKTIVEGTIYLYQEEKCEYPIVEIHELLHVFGFDHTSNPSSAMYNVSNCNQRITSDMKSYIANLYSIEPLADANIKDLNATKRGAYLDFAISISNEGMQDIEEINLTLLSGDKVIQVFEIDKIEIGYGRILEVTNVKLPNIKTDEVTFLLDLEQNVDELFGSNNIKTMKVSD